MKLKIKFGIFWLIVLLSLFALNSFAAVGCIIPFDGMTITEDTTFCEGEYYLPDGTEIISDGVVLDCDGAKIYGDNNESFSYSYSVGVAIDGLSSVTVKNCITDNYAAGIRSFNSEGLIIENNQFQRRTEGSALLMQNTNQSIIRNNFVWDDISLSSSSNNIFFNNTHYLSGISFRDKNNKPNNNVVKDSTFFNTSIGVRLGPGSHNNTIESNTFTNNNQAIMVDNWGAGSNTTSNHTIKNNTITAPNPPPEFTELKGIMIVKVPVTGTPSSGNKIHNNRISDMNTCIYIEETSDNFVYNNNLFNCKIPAYDMNSTTWVKNHWDIFDEPSEGCFDENLDNICDAPYVIDEDSQDIAPSNIERGYTDVVLYPIEDIIVNETDLIIITASLIKQTEGDLVYSINDSRFEQSENIFSWQTNRMSAGTYFVQILVTNGIYEDSQQIALIVNPLETLVGEIDNISSNIENLNLSINGSTEYNRTLSGKQQVVFNDNDDNDILVEFTFDFDLAILDLRDLTIRKQDENSSEGSLLIKGLELPSEETKTAYIDNLHPNNVVCVHDSEIVSVDEIIPQCNGENETPVPCTGNLHKGYTCTEIDGRYKIEGLKHSGVKEINCTESWSCTDWSACSEGTQTRTCAESNACGTTVSKPAESQSCNDGGGGGGGGGGSTTPKLQPTVVSNLIETPTPTLSEESIPITSERQDQTQDDLVGTDSTTSPPKSSSLITGAAIGVFNYQNIKDDPFAIVVIVFFVALLGVFGYELVHKGIIKKEAQVIKKLLKKKRFKILAVLVVLAFIIFVISSFIKFENTKYDDFANCLTEKDFVFYGASGVVDNKGTTIQKEKLGHSFEKISYVNCAEELQKCKDEKITGVPSWKTGNEIYEGPKSLDELSDLSGCSVS